MKQILFLTLGLSIALSILLQPQTLAQTAPRTDTRAALEQLRGERGDLAVRFSPQTGTPAYVQGQLARGARRNPRASAVAFFRRHGAVWGVGAPDQMLRLVSERRDELGYTSLRFEQRAAGFPVFDTDLRVQIDPDGVLSTINGQLLPDIALPALRPRLDLTAARQRAIELYPDSTSAAQRAPRLGIVRTASTDRLAWEVWLLDLQRGARWQIRIDALDGALISAQNVLGLARERYTFDGQQGAQLPGALVRSEGQLPVADGIVNELHDNVGRVYDYYHGMFGRDSFDDQGAPLIATAHYRTQNGANNAFWTGSQTAFGDGDGVRFGPLGGALDIVAHELTHGVIESTAGLSYQGQPGALNESFSDIFGMLIDDANWEIAETVYTPGVPGDALRSAADPTRYGDPGVWGEYLRVSSSFDNGGIHSNSGIFNKIAYEIGTTLGRQKTAHIFYRTLTQKLTSFSDFIVARDLTIQACDELVGSEGITDQDCADVRMAFTRAGLDLESRITRPARLANQTFLPVALERDSGRSSRLAPHPTPGCGAELIRNPGFEDGLVGWVSDEGSEIIGPDNLPHSGSRSARLSATYQLLQYVRLPADAQRATVQFNLRRVTPVEPEQQTFEVRAETTDGQVITTLTTLSGAQPSDTWLNYNATLDITNLRDLRLVFRDRYGQHYIDDVSIVAPCP